ncbi:MAG: DNA/RNA nuclease SfsA [Acidobacteriota bacterium]
MVVTEPLVEAAFVRRYKRFLMDVRLADGSLLTVHCPNSGSMEGCLAEGAPVLLTRASNPSRRLAFTAEWIRLPGGWVGINTHRTNHIVHDALRRSLVPELEGYETVRREVPYGKRSRVDFLLEGPGLPPCYVEVKNTTWPTPDGGIGFPDAVTERGLKHLRELRCVVREGGRSVMLFVVNREGGSFFRAAHEKDPAYARALAAAAKAGVEVLAYRVRFDVPSVVLAETLPCLRKKNGTLEPLFA